MVSPALEKLLVFQAHDQRRVALETQIAYIPTEISAIRRKIEEERAGIEVVRTAWREAEARRKSLETELGTAGQKILRFKAQQLEVRKNEEYQALGHEIELAEGEVQALEEEEIKALYSIDDAKVRIKAAEASVTQAVATHEARIHALEEKTENLTKELQGLQADLDAARAQVAEYMLATYVRLAKSTPLPVCVPLRDHKCTGCHLKVSSGVESEARSASKVATCDVCGRIVFCE